MDQLLAGRDAELAAVDRFPARIRSEPGILLIEGAAGIGKTTIWVAARERAIASGARVLSCRPIETETPLAFAALADLVEPVLDVALPALPAPQARALEVALFRTEAGDERPDQFAISAAVLGILRHLASERPLILCIDDLQWLDRPSARVMEYAARRVSAEPVGILATWRAGEGAPFDPERTLPIERVTLGPLSVGALQVILRSRLRASPSRPLVLRIHAASGGNPFYALEIARAIRAAGSEPAASEPLPIPAALDDLVRARLDALPARVRRTLSVVALIAQPTADLVEAASPDRESASEDLHLAARAGVIETIGERIRFTHPLLAAAAASAPAPADRRRMHARLAEVVAWDEERALHLALASPRPDPGVASLLEAAGREAYRRGADDAAMELAGWSIRLTPAGQEDALTRRTIDAAEYHFAAFDLEEARRLLETVAQRIAPGPARADVLIRLAKVRFNADRWDAATAIAAQALEEAGDEPRLRAAAHQVFAGAQWLSGDIPAVLPHAKAALDLSEGLRDRDLIAQNAAILALAEFVVGNGVRWDLLDKAPLSERWAPHLLMMFRSNVSTGTLLRWADEPARARERYAAEYALAQARGAESDQTFLLAMMAELELRAGNWDLADRYVAEGHGLASQTGGVLLALVAEFPRALLAACRGEVDRARSIAIEAMDVGARHGNFQAKQLGLEVLGFIALSLGDAAGCVAVLQPLVDEMTERGTAEPGYLWFMPDAMEAHIAAGDLDDAERLIVRWEEASERLGRAYGLATGGRCRGLLQAARGDLPGASAALERALEVHECLPMPLEHGRTLLAAGEVSRRAKRKRDARRFLEGALAIFDGLGASLWAARTRAELDRVSPRAAPSDQLTVTEERVARLVSEGRTNREVAAELFISLRTVEANLSRIYRKVGVRSRTELARALAIRHR